jgi:hypothetical protein
MPAPRHHWFVEALRDALESGSLATLWPQCELASERCLVRLFFRARAKRLEELASLMARGLSGEEPASLRAKYGKAVRDQKQIANAQRASDSRFVLRDFENAHHGSKQPSPTNENLGRRVLPVCAAGAFDMPTYQVMEKDPQDAVALTLLVTEVPTEMAVDIRYVKYEILKCLRLALSRRVQRLSGVWERRLAAHLEIEADTGVAARLCSTLALVPGDIAAKAIQKYVQSHRQRFGRYVKRVETPVNSAPDCPIVLPRDRAVLKIRETLLADYETADNPYVWGNSHLLTPFCSQSGASSAIRPLIEGLSAKWPRASVDPVWTRVSLYPYTTVAAIMEALPDGTETVEFLRNSSFALDVLRSYEDMFRQHSFLRPIMDSARCRRLTLGLSG